MSLLEAYLEIDEVRDVGQLAKEPLKLGHEVVRGDDDGAPGLVHGVQDAVLPEVGVHCAHMDVLEELCTQYPIISLITNNNESFNQGTNSINF